MKKLRKVIYSEYGSGVPFKTIQEKYKKEGYFHKWGTSGISAENGYHTVSVALIEDAKDGTVHAISSDRFQFLEDSNGSLYSDLGKPPVDMDDYLDRPPVNKIV